MSKDNGYSEEISKESKTVIKSLTELEESIYQTKIEVSQDEINYPRKLTNHLIRLYRVVINQDDRPSGGELERWADLQADYEVFEKAYQSLFDTEIVEFLGLLKKHGLEAIVVKARRS